MLNGQEEQAFAQIVEQIAADDPGFASSGRLQPRWVSRGHHVVFVTAAATALLCVLLALVLPAFVAAALAFVAYRFRPSPPGRPTRRPVRRRRRRPR